jgi:hypothetical protein
MTPDALRRLALALPEAHEAPHFERTSFRVGKKIFATMTADGREAMVKLASPDDVEGLLASQPSVFFSYGTWTTRNGALGVRLAKVRPALMRELVTVAWRSIAPKRAAAAFDAEATSTRSRPK